MPVSSSLKQTSPISGWHCRWFRDGPILAVLEEKHDREFSVLAALYLMLSATELLSQLPNPVAVLQGPGYLIRFVNAPLLALTQKTEAQVLGQPYLDLLPAPVAACISDLFSTVLSTGQVQQIPEVAVTNGDSPKYLKLLLTPLSDSEGHVDSILVNGFDITAEVLHRKTLEASCAHLDGIIELVAAGIVQTDLEGNIISANERFCTLAGYTPHEHGQHPLGALVHPDERNNFVEQMRQCAAVGKAFVTEHRVLRTDGTEAWVSSSGSRITGPAGNTFITVACIDISTQRDLLAQLDRKVREVSDYQYALDRSSIVAITDRKGVITYVNENFCRISGYDADELIGQDHSIVNSGYHPPAFFKELWQTIGRGQIWKGDIRNRAKDGSFYWVDTTIVPFLGDDGKPFQYVAIRADITERKLAQQQVQESEERYATVVEASELGLWDFDVPQQAILAAGKMGELYGLASNSDYNLQQLLQSIHPDDRAGQEQILQEIIDGKVNTSFDTEFRIVDRATGRIKWLRARAKAFFNDQGQLYRTVGTASDVTAQKQALVQLRESEERLGLVLEAAGIGLWDYNIQTNVAVLSERTRAFYSLLPEETFTFERFLSVVHPDDRERVTEGNRRVLYDSDSPLTYFAEFRIIGAGDQVRWNRSYGKVILNEKGERYRFIGAILDVTEEKEAAETLAESERQFRSLAEHSPDIITKHDQHLRYLYANPQVAKVLGIEPEALLGRTPREAGLPENLCLHLEEQVGRVLASQAPHSVDYPLPDGEGFMYSRFIPEFDAQGLIIAVLVISTDVSQIRKAEQALRESELRFRTIANSLPQLAWITDASGYVHWYNQRWFDYTGTTPAAMLGWGWKQVLHPDMAERVVAGITIAFRNGRDWEDTFLVRGEDGRYRWFLSRAVPVHNNDGTIQGWFGTNTDITAQRETEEALKLAKDQLELTFENVPASIYLYDKDGQIIYLNERGAIRMGFDSVAEVLAERNIANFRQRLLEMFELRDEAGEPLPLDASSAGITFRTLEPSEVVVQFINRRTQASFWVLAHSAPLFDPDGTLRMVLTTTTDITDQRMFTERLEQEVAHRTAELRRSNEDLQQFAHAASHDLKEPVRKVLTFLDRIVGEFEAELPERALFYLSRMDVAARRSFSMINGLLYYSKVDAVVNLDEPIDLQALVTQIVGDLELMVQQKQAHIEIADLPGVRGAPELIYQLFYNLLVNAIKFSNTEIAPRVQLSTAAAPDGMVRVVVADNGIGFDTKYAEQIFQTYTRLHSKDRYEGSGLGLSLCRKIAERHGGSISAEGEKGRGARFVVTLPGVKPTERGAH